MRLLWGVCFWLISASGASVYPDCPNLSEDTINALNKLKVTEDVHDMLVGDYREVWGPMEVVAIDDNTYIKFDRLKLDDTILLQTMTADGEWFGGKRIINMTLEKVDNGVYKARKDGVVKSVFFILYAKNNVVTHYAWEACSRNLNAAPSNSKKRYINFVTGVSVRSLHPFETPLQCSTIPLEPDIKAAVDETVREINEHEDLLGYIAPLDYLLPLCFSANSQKDAPANSVHAPAVPLWAHICFTVLIMFILK